MTEIPHRPYHSLSWRGTVSRLMSAERSQRPGVYSEIMSHVVGQQKNLVDDSPMDWQSVKRNEGGHELLMVAASLLHY